MNIMEITPGDLLSFLVSSVDILVKGALTFSYLEARGEEKALECLCVSVGTDFTLHYL